MSRRFTEAEVRRAARLFRRHYSDLDDEHWVDRVDEETVRLAGADPEMSADALLHTAARQVRAEKIDTGRRQAITDIIDQRNKVRGG